MAYKRDSGQFFDSYAAEFDAVFTNRGSVLQRAVNRFFRKSTRLRYEKTLENCRPVVGKTVIDVGCGPGYYAVSLAKQGAKKVVGIDISPAMISLAKQRAIAAGVEHDCEFVVADFASYPVDQKFDFAIVQGFMDYVARPTEMINKILAITKCRAFFSFPKDGGFLAWQRKMRYQWKCDLFMYSRKQLDELFGRWSGKRVDIDVISRDYFVTVQLQDPCAETSPPPNES